MTNNKVNIDVETATMRREHKRVNLDVVDENTLKSQVLDARLKFRDAGLERGADGKLNVAVVDFGNFLTISNT